MKMKRKIVKMQQKSFYYSIKRKNKAHLKKIFNASFELKQLSLLYGTKTCSNPFSTLGDRNKKSLMVFATLPPPLSSYSSKLFYSFYINLLF